ncbi:uncharacterized protein LOC127137024 [Lathyrus oleraceus]|uniref:uncharacterized protein LOC127137023 n=1 Tax=Pisum sativum TaxID=3888 RepID=UPI0021D1E1E1|nr:uncharacterized protein LOC127137023 [Pisum sativum]XP_050919477.1 uncharacterized protein LOC127137024 [Pisum sativum]
MPAGCKLTPSWCVFVQVLEGTSHVKRLQDRCRLQRSIAYWFEAAHVITNGPPTETQAETCLEQMVFSSSDTEGRLSLAADNVPEAAADKSSQAIAAECVVLVPTTSEATQS